MLEQAYYASGIIAAVGVIASLIFLAYQVRQNTKAVRNQHYQSIVDRIAENASRSMDEWVATILEKGKRNFNELGEPEKHTFAAWATHFIIGNNQVLAYGRQGMLDPEIEAMAKRNFRWIFKYPGFCQWWRDADRQPFPSHSAAVIDEIISNVEQD